MRSSMAKLTGPLKPRLDEDPLQQHTDAEAYHEELYGIDELARGELQEHIPHP